VEVGFGDFNITGKIMFNDNQTYIGYDVVESLKRPDSENKFFKIIG